MSFSIQGRGGSLFNRTITDETIQRVIKSSSKIDATHLNIWEKIKDWFCGTHTEKALKKIYELKKPAEVHETQTLLKKIIAFYQLKEITYKPHQDSFSARLCYCDGEYTFEYSIKNVTKGEISFRLEDNALIEQLFTLNKVEPQQEIDTISLDLDLTYALKFNLDSFMTKHLREVEFNLKNIIETNMTESNKFNYFILS